MTYKVMAKDESAFDLLFTIMGRGPDGVIETTPAWVIKLRNEGSTSESNSDPRATSSISTSSRRGGHGKITTVKNMFSTLVVSDTD